MGWGGREARVTPKLSGEFVAKFIYEDWICRIGHFNQLKSDNGAESLNTDVKNLLLRFKIKHVVTTPYHPQGNGMVERGHQNIAAFLRALPKEVNWEDKLSTDLLVNRTTPRSSTGYSPQHLVYGFHNSSHDIHQDAIIQKEKYSPMKLMKLKSKQLQDKELLLSIAKKTQERKKTKYKEAYDKRYNTKHSLQENDLVLVKVMIRKDNLMKDPKLDLQWRGPYKVSKIIDKIFKLKTMDDIPIKRLYTREFLKKYYPRKTLRK